MRYLACTCFFSIPNWTSFELSLWVWQAQLLPTASVDDIIELCLVFFDEIILPWQVLKIAKSKLQPDDPLLMGLGQGYVSIDNPNSETCLSTMKVVVICVQCFRSQAGLCWRVHGYSTQLHWQHSLQGTRQKWTDLSHHAQLSMCTSRNKMAASWMEFSVLIEYEFVAVVSWKVGELCLFYT